MTYIIEWQFHNVHRDGELEINCFYNEVDKALSYYNGYKRRVSIYRFRREKK